ncbi:CaiB/BaiF CoA transferase family protein [Pandoraea sputorum]|uniref:Formyl-coenzyme A transferase n=2 Tax=Pandoraea TaxID=93217 RepID=A0A239SL27_9BURK|nr:CaiB/BaiF CoA-transferase family protein [Pandoraea sputorum]AJC19086.2 carnitine dehydratase [Pandoraea sputorum]SNU86135.1 Formyl-coenzyme A transferase [Pandoraea sputorum]VVE03463.1 carnitine dehydratase [Pandoraea sputorum]
MTEPLDAAHSRETSVLSASSSSSPLSSQSQQPDKPLSGVTVLDLTRLLPGPLAGLRLAEMGARVIKIEDKGAGDYAREMMLGDDESPPSAFWRLLNRGKTVDRLDLKSDADRKAFLEHVAHADVLLEGFRPGVMARLGFGYEVLASVRPSLVMASISGYGQQGLMAQAAGHDINYIGYAGVLDQLCDAGDAPIVPNFQIGDLYGGAQAAVQEVLAALVAAQRTGRGRWLDISMTHEVFRSNIVPAVAMHRQGHVSRAGKDLLNGGVPCYQVYRTKDGRYMAVGALELKFWESLCDVLGRDDWKARHWALGQEVGGDDALALRAELMAVFAGATQADWVARFADADCCVTPVLRLEEAMMHPLFAQLRGALLP